MYAGTTTAAAPTPGGFGISRVSFWRQKRFGLGFRVRAPGGHPGARSDFSEHSLYSPPHILTGARPKLIFPHTINYPQLLRQPTSVQVGAEPISWGGQGNVCGAVAACVQNAMVSALGAP